MPPSLPRALVLAWLSLAAPALAQPADPQRSAAAQSLFDDARKLMADGRNAEACKKLEEVLRLEPGGHGARLRLAQCYEADARLASAWATYHELARLSGDPSQRERAALASQQIEALRPRISRLGVVVPADVARTPGLQIERDGQPMGEGQWGVFVPVDGGQHRVVVSARGKVPWAAAVDVPAEGATVTISVPRLADEGSGAAPPPSAAPPSRAPSAQAPSAQAPSTQAPSAQAPQRPIWPYFVGAAGVVMIGAAVAFRVDEKAVESSQEDRCGGDIKRCAVAAPGYDPTADNARKSRDYALFVGLGSAGLVAVGAAVIGLVTAPSAPSSASLRPSVAAWQGGASASLSGWFW